MSSEATPVQGSGSVTPPPASAAPPTSPGSLIELRGPTPQERRAPLRCDEANCFEALQLPAKFRQRSPSPMRGFLIPSPLPTRRNRTYSAAARAAEGPVFTGVCKCFCRSKGHGFITPSDGGSDIFVHISDIEGEYVPVEGDEVSYKVCSIPPKLEKVQAVEVTITHLKPGTKHETWGGIIVSK